MDRRPRAGRLPSGTPDANICSYPMVACVVLPRFELAVAAGGREALLGVPAALAPEAGREQRIGQPSPAAEAFGARAGMPLGEALARCPELVLVPPDPMEVEAAWERALCALEGIGAGVESERPGVACFAVRGLTGIHGAGTEGVLAAAWRALHQARCGPARIGAAPTRFCAAAAAARSRVRRPVIVPGGAREAGAYLAPLPVAMLRARTATADLPPALERLGITTLGAVAQLPRSAVADRFGAAGLLAHDLVHGRDAPPAARRPPERIAESLELPEAVSGPQLERALALLVDRLLARRERRGRRLRDAVLSAVLVEGGTWREQMTFREPLGDPARMRLALGPRLALMPAPAERLVLAARRFGPPAGDQAVLLEDPAAMRAARLGEGVRQARAAAGPDAALRVLLVDPASRVPERRAVLAPFQG